MKNTDYVAKKPNSKGIVEYTQEENAIWQELMTRQVPIVKPRACDEYLKGLEILDFPKDRIPQISEVNAKLSAATGWRVEPVAALISFDKFFQLLANRQFPAATFIRRREELDYLKEPDIFHEFFGHCPMLTVPVYADFMAKYGELGLQANHKDRVMLARLYWFTVEFGLIQTHQGLKIYGGGILSSMGETPYSLESDLPARKQFDPLDIFRTLYRIDIFQTVYFIIQNYDALYHVLQEDLISIIQQARTLGMHTPTFPPKEDPDEQVMDRVREY